MKSTLSCSPATSRRHQIQLWIVFGLGVAVLMLMWTLYFTTPSNEKLFATAIVSGVDLLFCLSLVAGLSRIFWSAGFTSLSEDGISFRLDRDAPADTIPWSQINRVSVQKGGVFLSSSKRSVRLEISLFESGDELVDFVAKHLPDSVTNASESATNKALITTIGMRFERAYQRQGKSFRNAPIPN